MRLRLRKLWLNIHRWLGLTAGLLFVLLGVTGSLLVFDHAIDEWLNPELLLTKGTGKQRSVAEILAAAERAYPGDTTHAGALSAPRVLNGVWTAWFQSGSDEAPEFTQVYVDPFTCRVTGQRVWGKYLISVVYNLHYRLLAGNRGEIIVGIAGLFLMVSACSGLYLWWPLLRTGWRAAFSLRSGKLFMYDLHKIVGIGSGVLLIVIAFTGVYMIFPEWIKPVVTLFSAETKSPTELRSTGELAITPDQAIAIAQVHFPNAAFCHFHPPTDKGVYEVAMRQAGEIQKSFGRTQIWIDGETGKILAIQNTNDATGADVFFASQFPLHNGEAFGLVGRWIVLITGLAPGVLYVTGFLLWWRKRRSRKRQRRIANVRTLLLKPLYDIDRKLDLH